MINKKAIIRFLNTFVWILITILVSYILMKSTILFSSKNLRQTISNLGDEMISEFSNQVILSNSPLLQYVNATSKDGYRDSPFINFINNVFPINHYSLDAFEDNLKNENETYNAMGINSLNYDSSELAAIIEENQGSYNEYVEDAMSHEINNEISFIRGETYLEDIPSQFSRESQIMLAQNSNMVSKLKDEKDYDYLINNFYIVDSRTKAMKQLFDVSKLLKKDVKLKNTKNNKPQILICHTHSQESFIDSKKGNPNDTIVGVGAYLAEILTEQYDYNVIHDTTTYDLINGSLDRNKAYNYALPAIEKTLKENPSIEVIIDLHRDGVNDGTRRITNIGGKKTAQLMFFNGLSRNKQGPIDYLENPYISNNLAFSLQLHIKSLSEYANFTRKIYLKDYRYNQHLLPKSLLIELGNNNNTVQEAKNAMEPLANILNQVLKGN